MTRTEFLPAPKSTAEALEFAGTLAKSNLIPKNFVGRPNDVFVAMLWSHTLGIPVVQGLQYIAVINGKPSMYGDGLLAVVMNSGLLEDFKEEYRGEGEQLTAFCTAKRKGITSPTVATFSVAEARRAGLLGKPGPWQQYTKRMLKMRARAFALRDALPDVLAGMAVAEEQEDIDVTPVSASADVPQTAAPETEAPARKMPRRAVKKAPDAEEAQIVEPAALENKPEPAASTVVPSVSPAPVKEPEPVPVKETAAEAATVVAENLQRVTEEAKPVAPTYDVESIKKALATLNQDASVVQYWKSLPDEAKKDKVLIAACKAARTRIVNSPEAAA